MKRLLLLAILVCSANLFIGCGGETKKEEPEVKIGAQKSEEKATDSNVVNVMLTGDDLMRYNKTEIRVKAGQKVRLTLRHIGQLDVKIMGHNFVLLKKDVDLVQFATKAATQVENNYIPEGSTDIIVHTDMIGGGQTTTIEFDAPEVGTYEYLCSFPAHYAMMRGKFIVE